jgi:hypothetical protein
MPESNDRLWYARCAGTVRGPLSHARITRDILLGRLRDGDELSQDRATWRKLAQLPELLPDVLRHADTPEDRQRQTLARLRVDERLHDRRGTGHGPGGEQRRHYDRRSIESLETVVHSDLGIHRPAAERADERNLLVPAAVILTIAIALLMYFIQYRPASPVTVRGCQAAAAPAVNWEGCDLGGRDLARADLREARLASTVLRQANLNGANLLRADLRAAGLREANLVGAVLRDADLSRADLRDANLGHASLQGATLLNADLSGARLDGATWTDGRVCAPDSIGACR